MIEYNERIKSAIVSIIKKNIQKYDAEIADIVIKKIPEFKNFKDNPDSLRRTIGRYRKIYDLKADRIDLNEYLNYIKGVLEKNKDTHTLTSITGIVHLKYPEFSVSKIIKDIQALVHGRLNFRNNLKSYVRKSK